MSSAEPARSPALVAGARFLEEIRQQPAALVHLLDAEPEFERVAAEMTARGATTIRMVGHGSSDNAASYGVYAFGLLPHWTALQGLDLAHRLLPRRARHVGLHRNRPFPIGSDP